MKEELNQRNRIENERGSLHGREGMHQVEGRRISSFRSSFIEAVVGLAVLVVIGVLAADLWGQIFEEDRGQVESLRPEGDWEDSESLLGFGQVDASGALRLGFSTSTLNEANVWLLTN